MISVINLFLPLIIQILILYFLSRLLDKLILRRIGRTLYLITQWPGVIVHEFSHLIACLITFTRVFQVKLFAPQGDTLGFVSHAQSRNPVKNIIISIAPLFGVTAVIWLLIKFLLPELYFSVTNPVSKALTDFSSFQSFFNFSKDYFQNFWHYITNLWQNIDFSKWQTYLFIYLMLSLGAHSAPSKQDLKHTYFGIGGLAVVFIILYYIGSWLKIDILWQIAKWLAYPVGFTAGFLTYGIVFAVLAVIIMVIVSILVRVFRLNRRTPR